jgi:carboxylate-amine ligase
MAGEIVSAESIAASFERVPPLTIGLEEEVFLLDPESLDLAPCALEVLAGLGADPRFKPELPAAQIEILTPPSRCVADAVGVLADGRAALAAFCKDRVWPMAAGVHPFASADGRLNRGSRYDRIAAAYGMVARAQLVSALQVHVPVGGADRTLAVYNALRSYLPELAALAANAPFHGGRDTGLASVRPKISEALPRQGVPPPIASWEAFSGELRWGATAGTVLDAGMWWWELRPHPGFGTLEVRVADSQTTVAEAAGVAAAVHCLVAWLAARYDSGETLPCAPTWRIAENRWAACRDGVRGSLADLNTGESLPTCSRLRDLFDQLEPVSDRLGCGAELLQARALIESNGSLRQRAVASAQGMRGLVGWLAARFREPFPG